MYRVQGTEFNGIFYIENVSTNNEKRHSWHLSLTNTEMILIFLYIEPMTCNKSWHTEREQI